jgi:glucose/arabinose dehydrogenase
VISTVAQLQPVPGRDGIDSIALDAPRQRLLLPDSAQGALRVVAVDGGTITTLATGLGRVVAATVGPDGGIYVAAEGTPGLWRVPAGGGSATPVGNLHDLDEVVTAGHLLYVTELADGTVRALDPASGDSRVLATGIGSPQGLAVLRDGRLAVTDSNRGLVLALQPC